MHQRAGHVSRVVEPEFRKPRPAQRTAQDPTQQDIGVDGVAFPFGNRLARKYQPAFNDRTGELPMLELGDQVSRNRNRPHAPFGLGRRRLTSPVRPPLSMNRRLP